MVNYNDWWDGKVVLETCPIFLKEADEQIKVCQWNDFEITDRNRIKEKQEEIFNEGINDLLEKWKEHFNNKYSRSESPELLLQSELKYFESIIFFNKDSILFGTTHFIIKRNDGNSLFFEPTELSTIRSYIDDVIIGGQENDFDFIHSPKCSYQRMDTPAPAQVYAKVLWEYVKWLNVYSPQQSSDDKIGDKQIEKTMNRIELEFEKIKDRCFNSEDDYEYFMARLLNFFLDNPFELPLKYINLKRDCKTKIAATFNPLHRDLSMTECFLRNDTEYFKVIRALNHFQKLSDNEIYKLITR